MEVDALGELPSINHARLLAHPNFFYSPDLAALPTPTHTHTTIAICPPYPPIPRRKGLAKRVGQNLDLVEETEAAVAAKVRQLEGAGHLAALPALDDVGCCAISCLDYREALQVSGGGGREGSRGGSPKIQHGCTAAADAPQRSWMRTSSAAGGCVPG